VYGSPDGFGEGRGVGVAGGPAEKVPQDISEIRAAAVSCPGLEPADRDQQRCPAWCLAAS
jgi:hypothetical protein